MASLCAEPCLEAPVRPLLPAPPRPVCISESSATLQHFWTVKYSLPVWPFLSAQFVGISYIWTLVTHRHLHPPQLLVSPSAWTPVQLTPSLRGHRLGHCPDPDPSPQWYFCAQSVLLAHAAWCPQGLHGTEHALSISCVIKAE